MDTTNFSNNHLQSNYMTSSNRLGYSYQPYSSETELSQVKLSQNNPYYNDPLISSLLEKYNNKSSVKDTAIQQSNYSYSYSTQATPKSCHSPPDYKQLNTYQSPPQFNQVKFSDVISDRSPYLTSQFALEPTAYLNQSISKEIGDKSKEQIEELNKEILKLRNINRDLSQQNEQLSMNLSKYELQSLKDQQSIDKYEKSIIILDQQQQNLESQLQRKNEDLINLQISQKKVLDEELQVLHNKYAQQHASLSNENQRLKLELEDLNEKLAYQNTNSQGQLQFQTQDSSIQNQQIMELQAKIQDLELIAAQFQQIQQENNILKDELIKRIDSQQNNLEGSQIGEILQEKDQKIDELQRSILYIHSQLETEMQKKPHDQEIEEFEDQLKEKIIEQSEQIIEQEERIEQLEQTLTTLEEKYKTQEDLLNQRTQELEELSESHTQMKEENLVLRIQVSCKEKEYNEMFHSLTLKQQSNSKRNTLMSNSMDLTQ